MSGIAIASAIEGIRPFLIETQALVSSAVYGNPQRSATGFDIRRMNMLLAVLEKRVGFKLAQKDVFLNIAGGLKVNDPAIDLSVISAILSSNMDTAIEPEICMAGEIGLSGEIRPVNRIEQRIGEAGEARLQAVHTSQIQYAGTEHFLPENRTYTGEKGGRGVPGIVRISPPQGIDPPQGHSAPTEFLLMKKKRI